MALITFRDTIREIVPWWLRTGIAGKLIYSIGILFDALGDALVAGVKARFPSASDLGALQSIGRERRIQRGRSELAETYITRLGRWLDSHARRGGPFELLAEVLAFWALPAAFAIDLVYYSGRRFSQDASGNVTMSDILWLPDSIADWARWWLFFAWPRAIEADGLWASAGTWDDNGIWDYTLASLSADEAADVRLVPREWSAAHVKGKIVLMAAGAETWDFPPGTWDDAGLWLENGTGVLQLSPEA